MGDGPEGRSAGNEPDPGWAAMAYRPSVVPVGVLVGAVLKNLPEALTELTPWVYLGCLAVVLGGAVLVQRRNGRAWPWGVAIAVGFGLALAAWLGAMAVVNAVATHELRPG